MTHCTARDIEFLHDTFVLFGNPAADFWFLGLEEGDHPETGKVDEFVFHQRAKAEYYKRLGVADLREIVFFGNDLASDSKYRYLDRPADKSDLNPSKFNYQKTWGGYSKLLFATANAGSHGEMPWTMADLLQYQGKSLGSASVGHAPASSCLMELFPLPRKGRGSQRWPYKELAGREGLAALARPGRYAKHYGKPRALRLAELMEQHSPRFLVGFGNDCRTEMTDALALTLDEHAVDTGTQQLPVYTTRVHQSTVCFSHHPVAHGISDHYWINLGKLLHGLDKSVAAQNRKAA